MTRDAEQEEFFRAHYPQLAGWAAGLVGDADVGRDLASEAFVRLLGRWTKVAEPRAFLYVTTANLVRDRWRRGGSRRRAMDLLHATAATSVEAHDGSLRDLIDRLPERRLTQPVRVARRVDGRRRIALHLRLTTAPLWSGHGQHQPRPDRRRGLRSRRATSHPPGSCSP